ncbi:MAG: hypothetical protein J6K14_02030 [Clostridia bacterium]|nr:hypothetical protein [Clostridia bacterium]
MKKTAYFFVDDCIWCLRDLARTMPKSIFDVPFLKMLKNVHDAYGLTVQLNLFYRTDFFYGYDEFTLKEVPDTYKAEWEANADWLKLAFHAKQEFPDYPYVNATYEDVKASYMEIINEIVRFAGERSVARAVIPHWLPISKAGCQALYDCGVRIISPSNGKRTEYTGNPDVLPYGHAQRLLHNRQPETMLFTRQTKTKGIASSICAYNHVSEKAHKALMGSFLAVKDTETGLWFKPLGGGPTVNNSTISDFRPTYESRNGEEFIGTGTHEQYFYSDYFNYQPDTEEKIMEMARVMRELGYTYITADELEKSLVEYTEE